MPAHQNPDPASDSLTQRLESCYTGVVHDIMRAMGLRDFTLPPELRPLMPERALAGPAFTIRGKVEKGVDAHQTLLAWTGLTQAHEGHGLPGLSHWHADDALVWLAVAAVAGAGLWLARRK